METFEGGSRDFLREGFGNTGHRGDYANCEWACTSALFTNDWNVLTYACFTIKSDVYEAFVNQEESFREGPFYAQITRNLLLFYKCFMNEAHCSLFYPCPSWVSLYGYVPILVKLIDYS